MTQPPALLNISCHKFVNETTGNIALVATWEIKSENISLQEHTLEAIDHYDVNLLEGESFTEGRSLLPSQSISLAVRCNEHLFSTATKVGYYLGVAYCIRNNSGELQVIGLRPVNDPKIQYHFRVSVFLVLQTVSSYSLDDDYFFFCSCLLSKTGPCFGGRSPADRIVLLILCQNLQVQSTRTT